MSETKKVSSARALFFAVENSEGAMKIRALKNRNHDKKFDKKAGKLFRENLRRQAPSFRKNAAAIFA